MFTGGAHKNPALFIYSRFFAERKNSAVINTNPSNSMRFRSKIVMTAAFSLLFGAVAANFFKISVLNNKKYQDMANDQHFGSISISAHRGTIYDSKGITLAKSATVYKIFIDPAAFKEDLESLQKRINKRNEDKANGTYTPEYDENGQEINVLPESAEEFKNKAAAFIALKLNVTAEKVKTAMDAEGRYSELKVQTEKAVADEILDYFYDMGFVSVGSVEDTKRYYPQNDLAASVIGFTRGNIAYGVESYYNKYLSGVDGRTVSAKDSNGKELPYRYSKTFEPKDGDDVYLTIDREIQYILEKHLKEMTEEHDVKNRSCAIMMNPKTGAILGMATYPSFDLNDPTELSSDMLLKRVFYDKEIENPTEKDIEECTPEARERQWNNKCISERYEPGSVFKIITAASVVEEKAIDFDTWSHVCNGVEYFQDGDRKLPIACHSVDTGGHGPVSFQEALTKSCNPAFMALGQALGMEKFQYYFDAFGFREPTGIDLPYEASGDLPTLEKMINIDLAEASFGQCETVTPLELITACSAVVNGGYLLQPYVVDKVVDQDGNIVLNNERTVRRQVISEESSKTMADALRNVVIGNIEGNVDIMGFSIGGKSGTSQRFSAIKQNVAQEYGKEDENLNEYGASYLCFTPSDDPELILLVLADMPDKANNQYYGSKCAVPCAQDILTDVLRYLDKSPEYDETELKNLNVKVPLLKGASIDDAIKTIQGLGGGTVKYEKIGNGIEVVEQSPITGTSISKDGCIYLYTEKGNTYEPVTVPDLSYYSPELANEVLSALGLNYVAKNSLATQEGATVKSQSIDPYSVVAKGTTIELEFQAQSFND